MDLIPVVDETILASTIGDGCVWTKVGFQALSSAGTSQASCRAENRVYGFDTATPRLHRHRACLSTIAACTKPVLNVKL